MESPKRNALFNPVLDAMNRLGSPAAIAMIDKEVIAALHLSPQTGEQTHGSGVSAMEYELGWARTYLKKYGLLNNTAHGVWALIEKGKKTRHVDPQDVMRTVAAQGRGHLKK